MLGTELHDGGIESGSGCYDGIGLLNITTTFETYRKTTIQVKRRASLIPPILSEIGEVEGYEIHMGESRNNETTTAFGDEGAATTDGLVFGTYMHALFRNINVINALLHLIEFQHRIIETNLPMMHWQSILKNMWTWIL